MTAPTMSLLDRAGLDRQDARRYLARGLEGADDGELYLEYAQSEMLVFDNGRLKQATYNTDQGFGLRAVKDEAVGYAHSSDISEAALARAADAVRAVKGDYSGRYAEPPSRSNARLYSDDNPLGAPSFETKVRLLETIDAYARAKDPRVRQVSVSFGASWQVIEILRGDGETYRDVRPLLRSADDMFVISRPGDELAVAFDARTLPPLRAGWKRTFLLHADGYSKEMNPRSASPDTVGPLPFRAMTKYPYGPDEHYPDTAAYREYLARYNTRVVSRSVPSIESAIPPR